MSDDAKGQEKERERARRAVIEDIVGQRGKLTAEQLEQWILTQSEHDPSKSTDPAGGVELSDADLAEVAGGADSTEKVLTAGCCGGSGVTADTCLIGCTGVPTECTTPGFCEPTVE
jgi:hypothetical protein